MSACHAPPFEKRSTVGNEAVHISIHEINAPSKDQNASLVNLTLMLGEDPEGAGK